MNNANDLILLDTLKKCVCKLQNTNKSNEKIKILKTYNNNQLIRKIFKITYDKNILSNLTSKKILKYQKKNKNITTSKQNVKNLTLFKLLQNLHIRKWSGNMACIMAIKYIQLYPTYEKLIHCILDKNLKIRMNVKQINKSFDPPILLEFNVALAEDFKKYASKFETIMMVTPAQQWYISKKIDGVRLLIMCKYNDKLNEWSAYSYTRQGKSKNNMKVIEQSIIQCLNKIQNTTLKNGCIFDGEFCKIKDGKDDFTGTISAIFKDTEQNLSVKYFVFDLLTLDEFYGITKLSRSFVSRQKTLSDMFPKFRESNFNVQIVEQVQYTNDNFIMMKQRCDTYEWEGLILRKNTTYKGKRSSDILKVKKMQSDEFIVRGVNLSTKRILNKHTGKMEDCHILKSIVVSVDNNDVNVGSGFTDDERVYFYNNPQKIIGKVVEIQYFEKSKNIKGSASLRFPVIKTICGGDKREY